MRESVQSWVLGFKESGVTDILLLDKEYLYYIQEMADIPAPVFEWSPYS